MMTRSRPLERDPEARGVDGHRLVALGLQRNRAVKDHSSGTPRRSLHLLQLLDLAARQRAGLVQQPADEGGFAVVDMADHDQLQRYLGHYM